MLGFERRGSRAGTGDRSGVHTGDVRRRGVSGAIAALSTLLLGACDSGDTSSPTSTATESVAASQTSAGSPWQELVDGTARDSPGVPGVALAVHAPGLDVAVASGQPDADGALTPERPFRIASNTKTFVAAAMLRLAERGDLSLDDPLSRWVDPALVDLLRRDGYDAEAITLRQLLLHTSGIADFAADVDYVTVVLGDPQHHWTREDQVRWAMVHGDPEGEPGTVFAYSDTGYVLLGDVIERRTGKPLGAAVRELLRFDQLGLDATWWEGESVPAGAAPMAHQFYETQDEADADPSFDLYGGGGLVSTVGDLATFYAALLGGEVLDRPESLATMTTVSGPGNAAGAAMGLFRYDDPQVGMCWSHSGFWGTFAIACDDVSIALSVFQARPAPAFDGEVLLAAAIDLAR